MNNRRTTLRDIAQKLGVSKTLVSFVVRDLPDGHGNISVRPELREKIKELAAEMNYVAHRSARALRTGESRMIGIISASSDHPIHFAKQQKICDEIAERGYEYLLQDVDYGNTAKLSNALAMMIDYSVEGIIFVGIAGSLYDTEFNDKLAALGIPVSACGGTVDIAGPCVNCGFYDAGFKLAEEMVAKGRRKFYGVTQTDFFTDTVRPGRFDGMRDACKDYGGVHVVMSRNAMRRTQTDIEIGYQTTLEFIDRIDADTLFYSNDFMAFGALRALQEVGIRVPDDVCVCGFDGIEVARFSTPSITTAIQPTDQMAIACVDSLFDQIDSGIKNERIEITIPAEIVFRESTGHKVKHVELV